MPATLENAFAPVVTDPRTGEILDADIYLYHEVLQFLSRTYFVQAAPLDPRARRCLSRTT
jgi:hypothetical protein